MVTIGDAFSVIATLMGICITAWALILFFVLFFQRGVNSAKAELTNSRIAPFLVGVLITVTLGLGGAVLSAVPLPGAKLLGLMIYLTLLSLGFLGMSGMVSVVADRIRMLEPSVPIYGALTRAALIVVVAALFPVLGWFLVGPVMLIAGIGAGTMSIVKRVASPATRIVQ